MTRALLSASMYLKAPAARRGGRVFAVARSSAARSLLLVALMLFLLGGLLLHAGTWSQGTGLFNNITLGALQNSAVVNRQWPDLINYDVDLNGWAYDVYVPAGYDGTKPYGVMVYTTSDSTTGVVLQTAATDKNLIWITPRYVGNSQDYTYRFGVTLLALYRAKELFNIDPRRVYTSGKSGGARVASALAFYHPEVIKGTAPSSGFGLPRLNAVTPDYITKPTGANTPDSFYDYSNGWFYWENEAAINAAALTQKLRSYIITRYDDYREEYFVESFHCAYEPQGQTCFLYDGPGGHQDASDAEMEEAIDYLDRTDIFPVNANVTAGVGGFSGMTNISQSGASAVEATSSGSTTFTLTPTLSAVAAAKTGSTFYWDNANGSTVRWLWEVKNSAPTNQKTCFGLWFANETWGGGAPVSVTSGTNPGILITITQNGSQNRMVISARPDSGGELVFYDGYFNFVQAYSTAWTSTHTGYLTGTGSPVEIRMDLNQRRWQLTFNGIALSTTSSIANGTQVSRDNKRSISGYWDSALGTSFWKHDAYTSANNTWSPFTKSIFTAATGAISGAGATPSPMGLRYVIASDPNLPDPPQPGPAGLAASSSNGVVNLTWNPFAGATSYTIQRSSVSGGPYTTIQSGITGTSYTDSNVTSGNIYYYTIFATTASGNTATVPEVVAGVNLQADTWVGSGADSNWQTAANWSTLPVAGNTLTFAGTARLSNTNNYAANTSFGGLMFNSGAGAFTLGGNAITLTGNVTNNGANTQTVNLPVVLASGSHALATNTGNLSIGGMISGSGSLSKSGAGTATLSANNTYGGGTTLTAGSLAFGNNNAFGTGTVILNGGTLKAGGGFNLANNIAVTGAASFDMAGNNTTLSGNLSGSAALTLNNSSNASTLVFGGSNSGYSGTITVNNGNAVSFNWANAGSANAAWVFNDAAGDRVRINISGTNTINFGSISGSGQIQNDTASSLTTLSVGALNTSTTFGGTIKDNGTGILALVKTGTGTLTLTGANTYSGGTTIHAGTLNIGAGAAVGNLGATGSTVTQYAGTLSFTQATNSTHVAFANNLVLNGGTINATLDGRYTFGSSTAGVSGTNTIAVNGSTTFASNWGDKGFALGGILSGTGAITIQNTGGHNNQAAQVIFLNDNNTYSGTVTATGNYASGGAGAIIVGGNNALQFANVVNNVTGGGANGNGIIFNVTAPAFGSLAGSGNFILTANTNVFNAATPNASGTAVALTVGGNNATTTYSAVISGLGSLVKTGTGTLTLSGTNTYSGATTINGGILNITGALSSTSGTVAVNNGGTLAGAGGVARATTVYGGGAIAPGTGGAGAAGTLTLSGGLTLDTGAVLKLDLAGTTTSDKLAVSGSISTSGTTTINLTALGSFAGSGTYPLITGASGINSGNFALGSTPSGYVCTLGASGGTLSLTVMTQLENWRQTNFGTTANSGNAADTADPDGDGWSNAQEFTSGTDPNNRASLLKVDQIQADGNDMVVSFPTVSGKTYRVERSNTLQSDSWSTVLTNGVPQDSIAGTGGIVQVTDTNGAAQPKRFYRIIVQ